MTKQQTMGTRNATRNHYSTLSECLPKRVLQRDAVRNVTKTDAAYCPRRTAERTLHLLPSPLSLHSLHVVTLQWNMPRGQRQAIYARVDGHIGQAAEVYRVRDSLAFHEKREAHVHDVILTCTTTHRHML